MNSNCRSVRTGREFEMNKEKIAVELSRDEWVSLGKFLSRMIGQSTDPLPIILLIDQLAGTGIKTEEMG
jgi:hypothetical protein